MFFFKKNIQIVSTVNEVNIHTASSRQDNAIRTTLTLIDNAGKPYVHQRLKITTYRHKLAVNKTTLKTDEQGSATLQYPVTFSQKQRTVFLKGEAYFDVTKKKKTPFIVRTDKYDIEVLGTQFDVDAYPDQTAFETTLMKGSVKVTSQHFPEQTITLKPHHKAYVKDGQLAVTKVNDFTPYRWKEGLICFKDEPFQTIMEDFEKYYGIRIIINNKKVLKYSYNGKFRQADGIDYALRVLQRDIHFKYEKANDEEIIYIN